MMEFDFLKCLFLRFTALCGLLALLAGCATTGTRLDPEDVRVPRFVFEDISNQGYATLAVLPISKARIPVKNEASISEYDVLDVALVETEYGKCLHFSLTSSAARDFYKETVVNQGRRLVLLVNGIAVGVKRVDGANDTGSIFIFAEIADEQMELYVKNMRETILEIRKKLD